MRGMITSMEARLAEIRADLQHQNQEDQVLRARFQGEINKHEGLLESEGCKHVCRPLLAKLHT